MTELDLILEPCPRTWCDLAAARPNGSLLGQPLAHWRDVTRAELGLDRTRPIVATGHQTLLWHPGILAKYLVVDAVARQHDVATANLIVDQHVGAFADLVVPVRRPDGTLTTSTLTLGRHRDDVPMALHRAFEPDARISPVYRPALESVERGVTRVIEAIAAESDAPDAARQMAGALGRLMRPWVQPMPQVTATELIESSLARGVLAEMVRDPHACAAAYNHAVAAVPEAGIPPLLTRADHVELPVWRLRDDGRRMRGYDGDVDWSLSSTDGPRLMPRALFMTALMRLGMCDLFVHGTGGAQYDRAMEIWIKHWLNVDVAPLAVASATIRLPFEQAGESFDVATETAALRSRMHDPDAEGSPAISPEKSRLLAVINRHPRRSSERRDAFYQMHRHLADARRRQQDDLELARDRVVTAQRQADAQPLIRQRSWAFPLFEHSQLDALAECCRSRVAGKPCQAPPA